MRLVAMLTVMSALGALDLAGAYVCKSAAHSGSLRMHGCGLGLFILIWATYTVSLKYAEMAPVTFGWIAALLIGILIVESRPAGVSLHPAHWLGLVAFLAGFATVLFVPFKEA